MLCIYVEKSLIQKTWKFEFMEILYVKKKMFVSILVNVFNIAVNKEDHVKSNFSLQTKNWKNNEKGFIQFKCSYKKNKDKTFYR